MAYRGDYPRGDASIDDVEQRGNRWYNDFNPVLRGGVGSPAGTPSGPGGGRKRLTGDAGPRYMPQWQTPGDESMYDQPGAPSGRFARAGQVFPPSSGEGGTAMGRSFYERYDDYQRQRGQEYQQRRQDGTQGDRVGAREGQGNYYDPIRPDPVADPDERVKSKFDAKQGQSLGQFYDDSYGRLLSGLAQGGQGSDIFQDVLRNFRGSPSDLAGFMESPAARMSLVYGIQNSPEFQESRDFSGFDTMFQAGAGDIANQAAQATSQGARLASRTGQGRNAALRTALASQASQGAAQQTAGLRGQVQMQRLQQAQRAFEQQRQLAALATGQITPRVEREGGGDEVQGWVNTAANVADIFI